VTRSPSLAFYPYGSNVQLTGTPAAGCKFLTWSGDSVSTLDPLTVPVLKNLTFAATFADTTPPVAQAIAPHGSQVLTIGTTATLTWNATDNLAVTNVDLLLSRAGAGGPFDSVAVRIANSGSFSWPVTSPATTNAFLEVIAHDAAGLSGSAVSDSAFIIANSSSDVAASTVREFQLEKIVPQPVHGAARLHFAMPRGASVRLSVLDVLGREVAVLADGSYGAGVHEVLWQDPRISAGLYFVKLQVPGRTFVQKLVRLQ
jgi:hypothetical protein